MTKRTGDVAFGWLVLVGAAACGADPDDASTTVAQQLAPNLAANPSFESGSNGDASSWTERSTFTRSNTRVHTGSWSLRGRAQAGGVSAMSAATPVKANTSYRLSGWIYRSNATGNAYLDLNDVASDPHLATTTAGSWQFVTGTWKSGASTSVVIRCVTENVNADVWFDDVSLTEEEATPPPVPPPVAPSLLANPSFELGTTTDATSWTETPSFTRNGASAHGGTSSLRATAATGGVSATSASIAVQPNATYRVSGWIYRTNATGNLHTGFIEEFWKRRPPLEAGPDVTAAAALAAALHTSTRKPSNGEAGSAVTSVPSRWQTAGRDGLLR